MTRPKKERKVKAPPIYHMFKPAPIRRHKLDQVTLTLSEYESIRLADFLGMEHLEASKEMNISRSTFTRLIEKARHKLSQLIIQGKLLIIEGGNFHFSENMIKCEECGASFISSIEEDIVKCGECGSSKLSNMAENFGHGRCCRRRIGQE